MCLLEIGVIGCRMLLCIIYVFRSLLYTQIRPLVFSQFELFNICHFWALYSWPCSMVLFIVEGLMVSHCRSFMCQLISCWGLPHFQSYHNFLFLYAIHRWKTDVTQQFFGVRPKKNRRPGCFQRTSAGLFSPKVHLDVHVLNSSYLFFVYYMSELWPSVLRTNCFTFDQIEVFYN